MSEICLIGAVLEQYLWLRWRARYERIDAKGTIHTDWTKG
jgi:hypothetical protein